MKKYFYKGKTYFMVRSSVLEKSCFLHRCSLNTFTCTPESVGLCMDDATVELREITVILPIRL